MTEQGREIMDRYLEHFLGKPLSKAERGERMDAYRRIGLHFGVVESTPRMWRARGDIPRHIERQIIAELSGRRGEIAGEPMEFDPPVQAVARDVQRIYDLTKGQGEVWRFVVGLVRLARTWARRSGSVAR